MSLWSPSTVPEWDSWANFGTSLVVIGVLLEGPEVIAKFANWYIEKWEYKRRRNANLVREADCKFCVCEKLGGPMRIFFKPIDSLLERINHWYERNEMWGDFVGTCGWGLVVIGLVLEFDGNFQVKRLEDKDNAVLNLRAATLQKQINDQRPEEQIVSSQRAFLRLVFNNHPMDPPPNPFKIGKISGTVDFIIGENEILVFNGRTTNTQFVWRSVGFKSDNFEVYHDESERVVLVMEFQPKILTRTGEFTRGFSGKVDSMKFIRAVRMELFSSGVGGRIAGNGESEVRLLLNSSSRTFSIPGQRFTNKIELIVSTNHLPIPEDVKESHGFVPTYLNVGGDLENVSAKPSENPN
jgi:hypothetical protein